MVALRLCLIVLVGVTALLGGCDFMHTPEDDAVVPEEVPFNLVPAPTKTVADGEWNWDSPVVGQQELWGRVVGASDDGKSIVLEQRMDYWAVQTVTWKTTNAGASWNRVDNVPYGQKWSPDLTRAVREKGSGWPAEWSQDGGQTWTDVPDTGDDTNRGYLRFWITNDGTVLKTYGTDLRILRSGASVWKTFAVAIDGSISDLSFTPDATTLLVNYKSLSTDGGLTWKELHVATGSTVVGLLADASLLGTRVQPETSLVVVQRSLDGGDSWQDVGTPVPSGAGSLTWQSSDGMRLGFKADGMATTSWDGGVTWVQWQTTPGSLVLADKGKGLCFGDSVARTTNDAGATVVPVTFSGSQISQIHRLEVSSDGSRLTAYRDRPLPLPTQAWTTTDGLSWQASDQVEEPSPRNEPYPPQIFVHTPDRLHSISTRLAGHGVGESNDSYWKAWDVVVTHGNQNSRVARFVDYNSYNPTVYIVYAALSDNGQTMGVALFSDWHSPLKVISTDGGATWWKSDQAFFLAWSSDGTRGLGLTGTYLSGGTYISTADSGASWSTLSLGPARLWYSQSTVFFQGKFYVARGLEPLAVGY